MKDMATRNIDKFKKRQAIKTIALDFIALSFIGLFIAGFISVAVIIKSFAQESECRDFNTAYGLVYERCQIDWGDN